MLEYIAHENGQDIKTKLIAYGGYTLQDHLNDGIVEKTLDSVKWDFVILNEQSTLGENYLVDGVHRIRESKSFYGTVRKFVSKINRSGAFDKGYRNLGLEALSNGIDKDTLLNNRGYPIQGSGFYIKDPQFGDLVRVALEIGYNVFPYEAISDSDGREREIEQAKNIQKVIEERPDEKFLIYCGFDHVLEGNHKRWGKAMAGHLAEYAGINPFTINQVVYSEKSRTEYNNPLLKALEIKKPTALLDQQNNLYKYQRGESWTDMAVFCPNTIFENGRPNWLFENGAKAVPITSEESDISYPVMILAHKKGKI